MLCTAYREQRKWDTAAKMLLELLKDSGKKDMKSLRRLHTLADIYLTLGDFEEAEKYSLIEVQARKTTVGRRHPLFYLSVGLLIKIYDGKGDRVEAEGYRALLPSRFQGEPILSRTLLK
jgi:hypothetical protein